MQIRRLLLASAALALCLTLPARAELSQQGDVIVSFDGRLHPTKLPRSTPAPVAITVAGDIRGAKEKSAVPQLRTISVAINGAGKLYDKGLRSCELELLQPAREHEARKRCGKAIVGGGHVTLQARIEGQAPFLQKANLVAFNGPQRHGMKLIFALVYANNPPGAFTLVFKVKKSGDELFPTTMSTTLPRSARGWAYLTHFDMTLRRTYSYRGKRRSYVSAACSAPAGFSGATFPFAKATYGFANGQSLTTTAVRSCQVR